METLLRFDTAGDKKRRSGRNGGPPDYDISTSVLHLASPFDLEGIPLVVSLTKRTLIQGAAAGEDLPRPASHGAGKP